MVWPLNLDGYNFRETDVAEIARIIETALGNIPVISAVGTGQWNLARVAYKLLVGGDSRNARASGPFPSLGGWVKTIVAIAAGTILGTVDVTLSAAHNIPVGQQVLIDPDAAIQAQLRNRWFDQVSLSSTSIRLSVPLDAYDYDYLVAAVASTTGFAGASASLTIDAIQGAAGSVSALCSELNQPWDEVVNLCVPGALSSDTLALMRTLDLTQFSHLYLVVGINDMNDGVAPEVTLANVETILALAAAAGCFVIVADEHPQGTMTATKQTFLRVYNEGLRTAVAANGFSVLVPVYSIINDPATNTGSLVDLISTEPNPTHWTAIGADKIGRVAAEVVSPYIRRREQQVAPISDINYVTNGTMTGTAGTVTAPSTGVCPTSWTVTAPGANVTCTAKKVNPVPVVWRPDTVVAAGLVVLPTYRTGLHYLCTTGGTTGAAAPTWGQVPWEDTADNGVVWTAITPLANKDSRAEWEFLQGTTGALVGAQERVTFQQSITLASVGLAAGDVVRGQMQVLALDSNWRNIMLALRTGATIDGMFAFAADGGKNAFITPSQQVYNRKTGIMRTPRWKIPAGQTAVTFYLEGGLGTGSENSIIRLLMTEAKLQKLS